eukprot:9058186-Pyramimonas_sp.AAC.1
MDANARTDASVMEMPLIGDSLPTSKIDETGKMLAEFNTSVGDDECWAYTDGAVMHRTEYVGIVGSWFQAAAGLRVTANLDNGLGKGDHRP